MESSGGYNVCPICKNLFPMSELVDHANKCADQTTMKSVVLVSPEKSKEEDVRLINPHEKKKFLVKMIKQKHMNIFLKKENEKKKILD